MGENMKTCIKCKKRFSGDFDFCPMCGNKLEVQIECPNCRKIIDVDFKYCPYCGSEPISVDKDTPEDKDNKGLVDSITNTYSGLELGKREYDLGNKYFNGDGVEIDIKEAVKWYKKAADTGNTDAQYILGEIYYYGFGIEEDEEEGLKWLRKSSEQGNADAQLILGRHYNCDDENNNTEEALKWYSKAAEQGNEEAVVEYGNLLNKLGDIYYNGSGVERDYFKATEYFRKAAELGNKVAQYNLGIVYYNGHGVEKSHNMAAVFFTAAAKQGYIHAQGNLGYMYQNGDGVPKNLVEACKWYLKAAEQGSATAQNALAECYYFGEGVTQDYNASAYWFQKAAEQNLAGAQYNLGILYENGQGVSKNYKKAIEWLSKAAELGYEGANKSLARVEAKLNNLNKTQSRPLKYLSELGIEIIRMALNNAFNENMWQACGFDTVPERGAIFNIFVSSEKLAKETFLTREFIIAPIGIFVKELRKKIYFPETGFAQFLAHYMVNQCNISDSLKFDTDSWNFDNDDIARKYFRTYIVEYVKDDSDLCDIFLKHCRNNDITPDQDMIAGAYVVCDSLSNFLEQKVQEISNKYYIEYERDIAGLGLYATSKYFDTRF